MDLQMVQALYGFTVEEVIEKWEEFKSQPHPNLPSLAIGVFEYIPELQHDAWEIIVRIFPTERKNKNYSVSNFALIVPWSPLDAIYEFPEFSVDIPRLMQHPKWDSYCSIRVILDFPQHQHEAWADLKGRMHANSDSGKGLLELLKRSSFFGPQAWQILKTRKLSVRFLIGVIESCPRFIAGDAWQILKAQKPDLKDLIDVAERCPNLADEAWTLIEDQRPDLVLLARWAIPNLHLRPKAWDYIQAHKPDADALLEALEAAEKCKAKYLFGSIWKELEARFHDEETMLFVAEKFSQLRYGALRVISKIPLEEDRIYSIYRKYPEFLQLAMNRLGWRYKIRIFSSMVPKALGWLSEKFIWAILLLILANIIYYGAGLLHFIGIEVLRLLHSAVKLLF